MSAATDLHTALHSHYAGLLPDGLSPRPGGVADGYVHVVARLMALEVAAASSALLDWLPQLAAPEALEVIGAGRSISRYPGESTEAYRQRVLLAAPYWQLSGTVPGLQFALAVLGYGQRVGYLMDTGRTAVATDDIPSVGLLPASGSITPGSRTVTVAGQKFTFATATVDPQFAFHVTNPSRVYEHYLDSQAIWAEFSIYLTPTSTSFTTDTWGDDAGDVWDDNSLWDVAITPAEINRILGVVNEVKPAHARLRTLWLVQGLGLDAWDDNTNWDDNSLWDALPPVLLWQRPDL